MTGSDIDVIRLAACPARGEAEDGRWALHAVDPDGALGAETTAEAALDAIGRPARRPLLLIHGFDFDPRLAPGSPSNPFSTVFSRTPQPDHGRERAWLPGLGLPAGTPAILIAWASNAMEPERADALLTDLEERGETPYEAAFRRADHAAALIDGVLRHAARRSPDGRVDALAHSLGTVALARAADRLGEDALGRLVLMHAAATRAEGAAMLAAAPGAEVVALLSRRDATLGVMAGLAYRLMGEDAHVCGFAGGPDDPRWADLQLDRDDLQDWAQALTGVRPRGAADGDPDAHWTAFSDPGAMALTARLVDDPDLGGPPGLRAAGAPLGVRDLRDEAGALVAREVARLHAKGLARLGAGPGAPDMSLPDVALDALEGLRARIAGLGLPSLAEVAAGLGGFGDAPARLRAEAGDRLAGLPETLQQSLRMTARAAGAPEDAP